MGSRSSVPREVTAQQTTDAFVVYGSARGGVHALSFTLHQSLCGYLAEFEHRRFAEVCKAWLGVARSGSPRCWPHGRVELSSAKAVTRLIKIRRHVQECRIKIPLDLALFTSLASFARTLTKLDMAAPSEQGWAAVVATLSSLTDLRVSQEFKRRRLRTEYGLLALRKLPLRTFAMHGFLIAEPLLEAFADSKMPLTSLKADWQLWPQCERAVAERFPQLLSLDLQVDVAGASVPASLPASLSEFALVTNPYQPNDVSPLPEALARTAVTTLSLMFVQPESPTWHSRLLAGIAAQLTTLILVGVTGFNCSHLSQLQSLRMLLLLRMADLRNRDLEPLASLPALRSLYISDCSALNAACLPYVARSPSLEALDLCNQDRLSVRDLACLGAVKTLQSLTVDQCGLAADQMADVLALFAPGQLRRLVVNQRIPAPAFGVMHF